MFSEHRSTVSECTRVPRINRVLNGGWFTLERVEVLAAVSDGPNLDVDEIDGVAFEQTRAVLANVAGLRVLDLKSVGAVVKPLNLEED